MYNPSLNQNTFCQLPLVCWRKTLKKDPRTSKKTTRWTRGWVWSGIWIKKISEESTDTANPPWIARPWCRRNWIWQWWWCCICGYKNNAEKDMRFPSLLHPFGNHRWSLQSDWPWVMWFIHESHYRWFSCNLGRHKQQWWHEQMLVDKQSQLMSDLLFTVHQHGGDDVTWKPPIIFSSNQWDCST